MVRGMSYRFRIPLSLVATTLFTALVIGLVTIWHTYKNVRIDLIDNGSRLSYALASAVQPALMHDDVWMAYSTLLGPRTASGAFNATLIVLDSEKRIFASSKPKQLPVAVSLEEVDAPLARILDAYKTDLPGNSIVEMNALKDRLLLTAPITSDGVPVGALLLVYPRQVLWPRFTSIVEQGGLSIMLVLAIIIPIGWIAGRRMVKPLLMLASCMARLREEDLEHIRCAVEEGDDEIGHLNARFHELLVGLREKRQLERQMVSSERLAAIGRLAAGVAHEINNPLGGMLVAIDTLRERGVTDTHTERTLSLLERGLTQIRDTVSALLVEAHREPHALTVQDIEDTRTLVLVQADRKNIRLEWDNRLSDTLPLPSTLVRQVVINILLNAVQFTPQRGRVKTCFISESGALSMTVRNEGETIEQKILDHMFEPYYSNREGGSGLGLWVTYQIVKRLNGEIKVTSQRNETCCHVIFPFSNREEPPDAN